MEHGFQGWQEPCTYAVRYEGSVLPTIVEGQRGTHRAATARCRNGSREELSNAREPVTMNMVPEPDAPRSSTITSHTDTHTHSPMQLCANAECLERGYKSVAQQGEHREERRVKSFGGSRHRSTRERSTVTRVRTLIHPYAKQCDGSARCNWFETVTPHRETSQREDTHRWRVTDCLHHERSQLKFPDRVAIWNSGRLH